MTTLSRSAAEPDLMTVECEVCFPAHIATTTLPELVASGWLLRARGDEIDLCHHCRYEPRQGREPRVRRAAALTGSSGFLPNFFIIGAAKAGTTSLHFYLDQHPDVFMAEQKELHFFCDPDYEEWVPLYREQFPVDAPVRGEASTLYTRAPAIPGVPGRIASLVPDARMIYLVRDPVERALASWREERFHVTERRPAAEAFKNPEDPHNPYVAASRYALQIQGFADEFGDDRILVLDQRELATDTATVVERVLAFLDLPTYPIDTGIRHNEGSTKLEYGPLGHQLRFSGPARVVRRLPGPLRQAATAPARRLLRKPISDPELAPDLLERLRATLAPDVARLRELTGLELAHWSL